MRLNLNITLATTLLCIFVASPIASAEPQNHCSPAEGASVSRIKATANAFSNMATRKGSLRYELGEMLAKKIAAIDDAKTDQPLSVILSTIPNKYQSDYSEQSSCETKLKETTETPIRYSGKIFKSQEDLVGWFYEFTQGNGEEGKDLYKRCPGSCSPQYTTIVKKNSEAFKLEVVVVCGHARDKWDNQYQLSSYLSHSC